MLAGNGWNTYSFARRASAARVIDKMVERFREVTGALIREHGQPPEGMRDWVTLASLVVTETGRGEERGREASVFVNPLAIGMPLQCDPTVIYALELEGSEVGERQSRCTSGVRSQCARRS